MRPNKKTATAFMIKRSNKRIMRVITLDRSRFDSECRRLRALAEASGVRPDCVVAIASGGVHVARAMGYDSFLTVSFRRPSTNMKRRYLDSLIRRIPRCFADMLRMLESRIASARVSRTAGPEILPEIPADLSAELAGNPRNILIVDDAVDSGKTLLAVCHALRNAAPHAAVITAVITVTQNNPAILPDFSLYSDRTLIRFPWSADYREK